MSSPFSCPGFFFRRFIALTLGKAASRGQVLLPLNSSGTCL
jgi:hypothetical protein